MANFPGGGVAAHFNHQACRWPLRYLASDLNIVPFRKTFLTRKMSTIFKSGLYNTFSNSTILNKNKQVSHCELYCTHPSPNPSAPQNIVWSIWHNRKFLKLLSLMVKTTFKIMLWSIQKVIFKTDLSHLLSLVLFHQVGQGYKSWFLSTQVFSCFDPLLFLVLEFMLSSRIYLLSF